MHGPNFLSLINHKKLWWYSWNLWSVELISLLEVNDYISHEALTVLLWLRLVSGDVRWKVLMINFLMFMTWEHFYEFYKSRVGHLRVDKHHVRLYSIITIKFALNHLKQQTSADMRCQRLFTFPGIVFFIEGQVKCPSRKLQLGYWHEWYLLSGNW